MGEFFLEVGNVLREFFVEQYGFFLSFLSEQGEFFLRIILAALCGAIIGYERMNRGKDAGIRTHFVVAAASALMMIISKYGFSDIARIIGDSAVEFRHDPSRLAAQIVSGVGFLGAGMIYINRKTSHGLTTAAGIWATSGIGMALGAGMYFIGILSTAFIYFSQLILHKKKFLKTRREESFCVIINGDHNLMSELKPFFESNHIDLEEFSLKRLDDNHTKLNCSIITPGDFDQIALFEFLSKFSYIKQIDLV